MHEPTQRPDTRDHTARRRPGKRTALAAIALAVPAALVFTGVGVGQAAEHTPTAGTHSTFHSAHKAAAADGLDDPRNKENAMKLVSSAENSSLEWRDQFKYIEDIGDGRGYTAGIIGFCSGTGDMLDLVEYYSKQKPGNPLEKYLPALREVNGSDSHEGLDPDFTSDWETAAEDQAFQDAQEHERDRVYFDPAVKQGKDDGLGTLGQFAYYDAIVMHGDGDDPTSFGGIRKRALDDAKPPSQGGDETAYLNAFLDARVWAMKQEEAHSDTSRVDTEQRKFLDEGNLGLEPPLKWSVYGEPYEING